MSTVTGGAARTCQPQLNWGKFGALFHAAEREMISIFVVFLLPKLCENELKKIS